MYLGKNTLNFLYIVDTISAIVLVAFLVGPELLPETSVAEFMLQYRGLMVYHCVVFTLLTIIFRKLHSEISVEIKRLQNWILETEKKLEK